MHYKWEKKNKTQTVNLNNSIKKKKKQPRAYKSWNWHRMYYKELE